MENGILYEYKSDYDLLVDAYHDDLKAHLRIEIKVNEVLRDTGIVKTPVSLIFHPGKHLNQSLRLGNYFLKISVWIVIIVSSAHGPFKQVFFWPVGAVVLPKISSSVTC